MNPTRSATRRISARSKALLVLGLLGSSAACTICVKLQNMTCVNHCSADDPSQPVYFEQPILQTMAMFFGGIVCLLIPVIRKPAGRRSAPKQPDMAVASMDATEIVSETTVILLDAESSPAQRSPRPMRGLFYLLLWIPAAMDIVSSTMMLLLFLYVPPSLFNMLYGLTVIFSGMLAAKFLDRRLTAKQCTSLATILLGVAISMSPDLLSHSNAPRSDDTQIAIRPSTKSAVTGVALAAVAQFLNAAQTVVEEAILHRFAIGPANLAGVEGIFGFTTMAALLVPMYHLVGVHNRGGLLDIPLGITQLTSSLRLCMYIVVGVLGQALGYYYSLSLVKHMGATSRITIDLCRTVVVWSISLGLGWETFSYIRALGFAVLVAGNLSYNG